MKQPIDDLRNTRPCPQLARLGARCGISLSIILTLAGCQQTQETTSSAQSPLEREIASAIEEARYGYSEVTYQAQAAGDDFADIIERCYRDQPGGLHDLFALSQAGLDGAGAEGYAAWLGAVLHAVGDNRFGDQLSRETEAIQDEVRGYLCFEFSCPYAITPPALKSRYPVTFPTDSLVIESDHVHYDTPGVDGALKDWLERDSGVGPVGSEIVYTEVCLIPYSNENIYIVRYDWDKDWWGDWAVIAVPYNVEVEWVATVDWSAMLDADGSVAGEHGEMSPLGQSINSVRSLWLEGQSNPLVEVIGTTHMGHGSIYLYELDIRERTLRLVLTTFVIDRHEDNTLIQDGGVLKRTYRDLNGDGYTDVVFTGSATYHGWEENDPQSDSAPDATPIENIALRKVFLWSSEEDHFVTDREEWEGFDRAYGGRE